MLVEDDSDRQSKQIRLNDVPVRRTYQHFNRRSGVDVGYSLVLKPDSFLLPPSTPPVGALATMFAPSVPIAAATPTSLPTAEIQDLPGSAPLPIPTRHVHANVAGVDTHVVCQLFTDRLVVLISQVGKIGTLVRTPFVLYIHMEFEVADFFGDGFSYKHRSRDLQVRHQV